MNPWCGSPTYWKNLVAGAQLTPNEQLAEFGVAVAFGDEAVALVSCERAPRAVAPLSAPEPRTPRIGVSTPARRAPRARRSRRRTSRAPAASSSDGPASPRIPAEVA